MLASYKTPGQLGISGPEKEIFDRYSARVNAIVREEVSWQKLKEPMIDVYVKFYTEQELQDIIAFYSTPSGKSFLGKMPLVMQESMSMSQSLMTNLMPKIRALTEELQQEILQSKRSN